MRRIYWIIITTILMFAITLFPLAIYAQDQTGSINGIFYRDINANGVCSGEGEPRVAANIPLELVQDDAGQLVRITSAADGSFFYDTEALGLWRVTVVPGQGWRVTSLQTREVVLTVDNPTVGDIDFCIIEIELPVDDGGTTLPESGAPVDPRLLLTAAIGFTLITAGAALLLLNRLKNA